MCKNFYTHAHIHMHADSYAAHMHIKIDSIAHLVPVQNRFFCTRDGCHGNETATVAMTTVAITVPKKVLWLRSRFRFLRHGNLPPLPSILASSFPTTFSDMQKDIFFVLHMTFWVLKLNELHIHSFILYWVLDIKII